MPKTTSFLTGYGYIRHPEDVDHKCFWCGVHVQNGWDYTPPRKKVAGIERAAKAWREMNPGQPFYAVTCCEGCRGAMYSKQLSLLTITHKKFFWSRRAKHPDAADGIVDIVKQNLMYPWQVRLGDGSVTDKPDEMCNAEELQAKRVFYGMPAPDLPKFTKHPEG